MLLASPTTALYIFAFPLCKSRGDLATLEHVETLGVLW